MKALLQNLTVYQKLEMEEAYSVMKAIGNGEANNTQMAAFMTTYMMRMPTVDEIIGFRKALIEVCLVRDFSSYNAIDIVGTGGDGKNTFNISTISCFVVAGAGIYVTKHGNYGVSSISGSSNVLEYFGVKFTNDKDALEKQLEASHFCMLHAPLFHPALKNVAGVRKELGMKTVFNILGPLVNPSNPKYHCLGTYNLDLQRLYTYIHQDLNSQFTILHSLDGYDEISLTGPFKVTANKMERVFTPTEFGLSLYQESDLHGGETVAEAATIFRNILDNKATQAQKDVVLVNAAASILCIQPELKLAEAIEIARTSLESGNAKKCFEKFLSLASA
ncbi:MAG: anthranilate phosphoribosyltransferase [Cytophagaceae bacterium]